MPKSDCIFCKIINQKLPSYLVYEDDSFYGFLDIHPLNPGNSLLVPKDHYRWVNDVPNFGDYWQAAKTLSVAIQEVTGAESISYLTLGYEVEHAHIRIIPRFPQDAHQNGINIKATLQISPQEMQKLSDEIYAKTNPRN